MAIWTFSSLFIFLLLYIIFILDDFKSRPILLRQLKKRVRYNVRGRGQLHLLGKKREVLFLGLEDEDVITLMLPLGLEIPEEFYGFYVIDHRNHLGVIEKGIGEIVFLVNGEPKSILFNFYGNKKPEK